VKVNEALRYAEKYSQDFFSINRISVAKDRIEEFLRSGIQTSVSNCHLSENFRSANCGWLPMRSKFPVVEGLWEKHEHKYDLQHGNVHSVSGSNGFFQSGQRGTKPAAEILNAAELLSCKICNVNCISFSQLKQHVNGYQHQARLVGEDSPRRREMTYPSKRNNNFSLNMVQKVNSRSRCISEYNLPKGRMWKMKDAEISKRWLHGNRQKGNLMWCDLCNVTCNGSTQYIGHKKGKGHRNAVEKMQKNAQEKFSKMSTQSEFFIYI